MSIGLFTLNFYIILIVLVLLTFLATRNVVACGLIAFSFTSSVIPLIIDYSVKAIGLVVTSLLFLGMFIYLAVKQRFFWLDRGIDIKTWRMLARPLAFLFIPINQYFGKSMLLMVLGLVTLVFISLDFFRIFSKYQLRQLFKRKESQQFSSITAFLVSLFIVFLVFPTVIAYLCLSFMIMGDLLGKFYGLKYGHNKLVKNRTLEGSLGFLCGSLWAGFVMYLIFQIPLVYVLIGASVAMLVELFSWGIDDNFSVGLVTGGFLAAIEYFI